MNITKVGIWISFLAECDAEPWVITLEKFDKLQDLLNDFIPVMTRIDGNVSRIERNVDEIYKYIEGENDGNSKY